MRYLKSDREDTSRKELLVITCTGINWVHNLKLLLVLLAACLPVWSHWDTCVEDWLAFKCHSLSKCDKCEPLHCADLVSAEIHFPSCSRRSRRRDCESESTIDRSVSKQKTSPVTLSTIHKVFAGGWRGGSDGSCWCWDTGRGGGSRGQRFVRGRSHPPQCPGASPTPPIPRECQRKRSHGLFTQQLPSPADRVAAGTVGSDYEYKKLPRRPQSSPHPAMPITHMLPSIL